MRSGAAIGSLSARAQIAVAGVDRATYLQGLLTNDIQALAEGTGCYAAWLSPQGRMLTDMHVLQSEGMILLDVPAEQAATTLARLDQFLFAEDVRIESLAESMTGIWVHGPKAADAIGQVVGADVDVGPYQHVTAAFGDDPVSVARIDQLGVPGYCVFLGREAAPRFVGALVAAGGDVVSPESLLAARIEAGYPIFGIDMTDDTIPLEAGIEERAISFSKGCFVGQEVVVRVLHRGGGRVARKLVGLKLTDASDVELTDASDVGRALSGPSDEISSVGRALSGPSTEIYSGDRKIGFVTSAATSPRLGPIALGYVHRDFTAPGTGVQVSGQPATVVELPMR